MGTSLFNTTPQATYPSLIKLSDNLPLTATLKALSDGLGNDSVLALSTTSLQIGGATGATWDNTNKRLGIGTTAPSYKLDIKDATNSQARFYGFQNGVATDDSGEIILGSNGSLQGILKYKGAGGQLIFQNTYANNNSQLNLRVINTATTVIDALTVIGSGNVGIGTTTPTTALEVAYNSSTLNGILINQLGASLDSSIGFANAGVIRSSLSMNINTGECRWNSMSGGYFPTIYSSGVERMRITAGGLVGIGTAAPTAKLEQQGGGSLFNMTGGGTNSFRVQRNTITLLNVGTDNASIYLTCDAGNMGSVKFVKANGTQLMQISDVTTVATINGIGATSATTSLLVQNSAGDTSLQVTDDQQLTGYQSSQLRFRLGSTTYGQGVSTRNGEVSVGYIDANNSSGLRFFANGSGSSFIDGWTEGASKGANYPLFIGSRANNTGSAVSGSTTQENGTQTIFGSAVSAASAQVQINSTTRGFLPPRMTTTEKNAIASPAAGLMVYDSTLAKLCVYTTAWETITSL